MITRAYFNERPESISYNTLPTGKADLWMRKNITEITDPETQEVSYAADEAYMLTDATEAEIAADFEGWFTRATAWQPPTPERKPTPEERITTLETENAQLKEHLANTMQAVDFLLFSNMEV